jgi:hypothetical protein
VLELVLILKQSRKVAEATTVSERSACQIKNEPDSIESSTSASFSPPHKVRTINLQRHHWTLLMNL